MPGSSQPPRLRFRERGRARRRLRYLHELRELQLRDAGGFLFDLYRFGVHRNELVRGKLEALIATDKEIRSLEDQLGVEGRPGVIRRPGVGGRCASCGAFHSSESRFCAQCGVELAAVALAEAPAEPEAQPEPAPLEPVAEEPVTEVQPAIEEEAALAEEPPAEEPAEESAAEEQPSEEPVAEEESPDEPPEDTPFEGEPVDGEVTVARQEEDAEEAPANGALPEDAEIDPEHVAGANGEAPAEPPEVDPDTGEVAAVGRPERSRSSRSRARRRRGSDR